MSFDPGSLTYSFSGGSTSPGSVAASDLSSFSVVGGGGNDTLTLQGGSPTLLNDAGADGTAVAVEVTAGSTLNLASTERLSSLTLDAGSSAVLLGNGHVLVTNALTIAGSPGNWQGQLDLADNALIVHHGDLATLSNQVQGGLNGPGGASWQGQGVTSSAAANDAGQRTAVGVIQNSTDGTPTGAALVNTFASQPVVPTDVLARYTFFGDANLDGTVNGLDYGRVDAGYANHSLSGWFNGDLNYDGAVDGSDYTLIDNAFNTQTPLPTGPAAPTGLTIVQSITGEVDMQWNPTADPAVVAYNVYVNSVPNFTPTPDLQIASGLSENGYSDYFNSDPNVTWYYEVTAVDANGKESLPSTSAGATVPASTPDDYTDAPDLAPDPNNNGSFAVAPVEPALPQIGPAVTPTTNLFAFYGAGSANAFGNRQFGNEPNDNVAAPSIVSALGGTMRPDKTPYTDFGLVDAVNDLCTELDTNSDHVISAAEIAAENIKVVGYSWGAVEAINFTRQFASANPHFNGRRTQGVGKRAGFTVTGGYNLQAPVTVTALDTLDPVQHAVAGLSGLIKTTDGPLANVAKFRNYYETKGGGSDLTLYYEPPLRGPYGTSSLGNFFSGGFTGDVVKSVSPDTQQIDITTDPTFSSKTVKRFFDETPDHVLPLDGQLQGSQVQHDGMPFFLHTQVINDLS